MQCNPKIKYPSPSKLPLMHTKLLDYIMTNTSITQHIVGAIIFHPLNTLR